MPAASTPRSRSPRLTARRFGIGLLTVASFGLAGWILLHRVPGLAPLAADTARTLIGDDAVARAEDFAYRIEDGVKRVAHAGEAPRAHWQVAPPRAAEALPAEAETVPFRPADVGPMHPEQAAPGDGVWVTAGSAGIFHKTLIHPDPERSYAELFVAAVDLARVDLQLAPGTMEPLNVAPGASALERSGRVPEEALGTLLAAFNGGFKTRHGNFGMRTSGVTLVPAKAGVCTVARYSDGTLRIGTWETLPQREAIDWFRQTPGCMVEGGVVNPKLGGSKSWGATLDGDTVIRRSAVGLSADGGTLFVAISNATSAEAFARGLHHAGAAVVAQLDVNHSYPRMLFYSDSQSGRSITPLAEGFVVEEGHYLSRASKRDFFYITAKPEGSLARGEAALPPRG